MRAGWTHPKKARYPVTLSELGMAALRAPPASKRRHGNWRRGLSPIPHAGEFTATIDRLSSPTQNDKKATS